MTNTQLIKTFTVTMSEDDFRRVVNQSLHEIEWQVERVKVGENLTQDRVVVYSGIETVLLAIEAYNRTYKEKLMATIYRHDFNKDLWVMEV